MLKTTIVVLAMLVVGGPLEAQDAKPFDAAKAFGARPSVTDLRLSPDGTSVAYLTPVEGQGSVAYTLSLAKGSVPKPALKADGNPFRLGSCNWVSNKRLVCEVYAVVKDPTIGLMSISRIMAVDADGANPRQLSTQRNNNSRGILLGGGDVIDWLPDEEGAVLMMREYLTDDHLGSRFGSNDTGLGVDWIDTRTLAVKQVERPHQNAIDYISDGRGTVRIMATRKMSKNGQDTGVINYLYRAVGSHEWQTLSDYNSIDRSGFYPVAVDRDLNIAYGFKKKDGRLALYDMALNASLREELLYARPDVDVDGLIKVGRRNRAVGASYVSAIRGAAYFAPDMVQLTAALSKALPKQPILQLADSSVDESKMLLFAGSDSDPGVYYIFDRNAARLETFLVARGQLEGVKLASVKPITYPAADGVLIPAYLTLPPGREDAKGLPAIVLPHGGPSARDNWGFDWLSQFYASRGFAVLQPNFRGSSGYGDAWFQKNGFQSWPIAIGDVLAAGRWLVSQGIADPSKLGIVGWSYGGYAALQSAIVDPTVFKAVVAIAPVTDLAALKAEHRYWSDYDLVSGFVGDGPQMREGSPAQHADKIKAPVLLFHAGFDSNVGIEESKTMAARLTAAGARCELVTWDNLDHQLDDSEARELMLRKSDAFLRQAFGL
jgi:acetyl esterase/lipase